MEAARRKQPPLTWAWFPHRTGLLLSATAASLATLPTLCPLHSSPPSFCNLPTATPPLLPSAIFFWNTRTHTHTLRHTTLMPAARAVLLVTVSRPFPAYTCHIQLHTKKKKKKSCTHTTTHTHTHVPFPSFPLLVILHVAHRVLCILPLPHTHTHCLQPFTPCHCHTPPRSLPHCCCSTLPFPFTAAAAACHILYHLAAPCSNTHAESFPLIWLQHTTKRAYAYMPLSTLHPTVAHCPSTRLQFYLIYNSCPYSILLAGRGTATHAHFCARTHTPVPHPLHTLTPHHAHTTPSVSPCGQVRGL